MSVNEDRMRGGFMQAHPKRDPVHIAMKHPNRLGAAKKRKKLGKKDKVHTVLSEFKRGTLHSGSGGIVKNRKQAIAIGMSEAGISKKS